MFVFYDTETTGLDLNFSQILQIALVFTDDDLNILSSKKLECRRSPWVVPSPGAMLITGFVPDDLKNNKHSHYEMMREVDEWVRGQYWPLTFVGYNSLGFDEPLLAQNFHQNLLDPGLTSSSNDINNQSNGRADVMILVKAIAIYMPGVLKLDIKNGYGAPSMTLMNVARQNGVALSDDDAHDSMNDIKATLGVAKFLHKAAPQMWEQMMKLSTVEGVDAFLHGHDVFTYATSTYGKSKLSVMTSLAAREGSSTQALYDLSIDPAPYLAMSVEQLKDVFLSKDKTPFALMRKESQPILMPMELSGAVLPETCDEELYASRAKTLHADRDFLERIAEASLLAKQAQALPAQKVLPEMMIGRKTDASVSPRLAQWIEDFHCAPTWQDGVKLIDDFYVRFKDDLAQDASLSRFVKFAGRIIYEHAPDELSAEKQEAMKKHIASRVLNPDLKAPYMTVAKARKELEQIEKERAQGRKWTDATDSQIRALKLYYTSIEKEYAAYAPAPVNDNAPSAEPERKRPPFIQPK